MGFTFECQTRVRTLPGGCPCPPWLHTEKLSTGIHWRPSTNPGQCHVLSIRMQAGCSLPECRKGWVRILTTAERGPWPQKQLSSLRAVWRRPGILDVRGEGKPGILPAPSGDCPHPLDLCMYQISSRQWTHKGTCVRKYCRSDKFSWPQLLRAAL